MKFYYNGKLVRSSKSHDYNFALIDIETGNCKGCSATKEGVQKVKDRELSLVKRNYEYDVKMCEKAKKGEKFSKPYKSYDPEECARNAHQWIVHITEKWVIVELEKKS